MKLKQYITLLLLAIMALTSVTVQAQQDDPFLPYTVTPQNLLKFNRFLINPTFSTVREDKSYVNLLHRNQSVQFQDNDQTYFLSYSGRIGDKSGLGLSLYSQKEGALSNIGILANYAYGIKLSDKSNFTFGGNLAYYSSGLRLNSVDVIDPNDFRLNGTEDTNIISFQPGFNISYGQFDFGVYAENLIDYNIRTTESLTNFNEKTFSAHLQYTYPFNNTDGIFESARLLPLARVRVNGQNNLTGEIEQDLTLGGSLILDLPKLGWLQGGYDNFFGASAGAGFNINKRLSLGYTFEKGFGTDLTNLGVTHEISFAYSFTPNLTEDRVLLEDSDDNLVENSAINSDDVAHNEEVEKLKKKLEENDAVLAELMYQQDSIESHRQKDLERRFSMVMRMVRNETNGERPDLENRAENIFLNGRDKPIAIAHNSTVDGTRPNSLKNNTQEVKYENAIKEAQTNNTVAVQDKTNTITQKPTTNNTVAVLDKTNTNAQKPTTNNTVAVQDKINTTAQKPTTNNTGAVQDKINTTTQKPTTNNPVAVQDKINTTIQKPIRNNAVVVQDKTKNSTNNLIQSDEIKSRKFRNLDGVEDGYYLVANVYKGGKYMNKFINTMNDKGFDSGYIDNPSNGLKYVYLERFNTWQEAADAYNSNMNGNYSGNLWVMNVDNRYTNEAYASNVDKLKKKSSKYTTDDLQQNVIVKDKVASNKVAAKAYKFDGIGSGFYIVANVFANPNNAKRFIKLLNSYGLSASYFINPENNWRYVYLKRHESWNNALLSYYTKLNDTYDDKMWIMRVKKQEKIV